MLTRELAIAEYSLGQIIPDRLTRHEHAHYVPLLNRVLAYYRDGTGKARRDLHRFVNDVFAEEADCPQRRIGAFCKLLDEKATYDRDRRGNAAKLRRQVFRRAAGQHPLVQVPDQLFESKGSTVKQEIAKELGTSWPQIERELFADVIEFHRLASFDGYPSAESLLARYNVAQCQAVLYDAIDMTVWAGADFKTILRYAKLARLMHVISRKPDGSYLFRFDGPASVLRQSRRYGIACARFLPALLACTDWKMQARIQHRRSSWQNTFRLSPADGLNSHHNPAESFDSELEEKFARSWGDKPRDGWTLRREAEVLHEGQTVFVPDFLLQHETGSRVMLEIVGYWTPEYLHAKLQTMQRFKKHRIIYAVADTLQFPDSEQSDLQGLQDSVIRFKTSLSAKKVLEQLTV